MRDEVNNCGSLMSSGGGYGSGSGALGEPVSVAKADDDIYESRAAKKSILNKNSFLKEKYLLQNERVKLAKKVDLTVTQAKIWFQNRRTRWRKEQNVSRAAANELYKAKLTEKSPELVKPNVDQTEKIVTENGLIL